MLHKGPHFSIDPEFLIPRVLQLPLAEFAEWPEGVRDLARNLAEELFLVRYNPFINPDMVKASAQAKFNSVRPSLADEYARALSRSLTRFWAELDEDRTFRRSIIKRLQEFLPELCVDTRPNSRIECATDATDLRMELPLLVVAPETTEQVRQVVLLANEMGFALIPRGGGSGATGGAVPASRRSVILSLARMKRILSIDKESMTLCAQAGVITLTAINEAARQGLLFTVDPASKSASSIGGNVSENAGGPFCFEYGTTIDNIYSYKMVMPMGEIVEVRRKDHPWHKILPHETAVFEILDSTGQVTGEVSLSGTDIRKEGLGKDVTNKFLGGLPGVQKEGVDGIITEACFTCYPIPAHARVLCLEFFGRSMQNAMYVVKDIVALRNRIREEGDLVKISALEEFGIKYVQAIEYAKKSDTYEGDPISVLIVQLDSDDDAALDQAVGHIVDICGPYEGVDVFVARDAKEAELFWEDRHKLSAIARRTSGFKINEDVVIPTDVIPEFAAFIEQLNLEYAALAYRTALQDVGRLEGMGLHDKFINMEFNHTSRILMGEVRTDTVSDEELAVQVFYFFKDLKFRYPHLADRLNAIYEHRMVATRLVIAIHMHAGDGNCHVNIPVNSNDKDMLHNAEEAAEKVMAHVGEIEGVVTGEHGVGITKIAFLPDDKMEALKQYKESVDPKNILNPDKLVRRDLPVKPYTFSFNRLIEDIRSTGLPDKDKLINLLKNIQVCTRCGKCKQVCPMYYPQKGMLFHPRNKNISLGALIEAIYYTKVHRGELDDGLMKQLRTLVEHCTGCGKCTAVCPVKIDSPSAAMDMRSLLEQEGAGGHPIKSRVLEHLAKDPARLVPLAAKAASVGQSLQNKAVRLVPATWRARVKSPLFSGPGPLTRFTSMAQAIELERGSFLRPANAAPDAKAVFYFPGCGGGLFYGSIGLAGLNLLLDAGIPVVLPPEHMCCGYPLFVSGCGEAYEANKERNITAVRSLLQNAQDHGFMVDTVLTACGSCRDALTRYGLKDILPQHPVHKDVVQYLLEKGGLEVSGGRDRLLYHAACHAEWSGLKANKASAAYCEALSGITGARVDMSPGCCGESGLGAMTSPNIYNELRARKAEGLEAELADYPADAPLVVGCPSCKVGISRTVMQMDGRKRQPVLHTLEYLAEARHGKGWEKAFRKAVLAASGDGVVRVVRQP